MLSARDLAAYLAMRDAVDRYAALDELAAIRKDARVRWGECAQVILLEHRIEARALELALLR